MADGDPYYPIPRRENGELYHRYQQLADEAGVHFVGRLATYKYYNMDQVVAQALTLYAKLANMSRAEAAIHYCEPALTTVTFPMEVKTKRSRTVRPKRGTVLTLP